MVKDAMIARGLTTGKASRVKKHKGIKDLLEWNQKKRLRTLKETASEEDVILDSHEAATELVSRLRAAGVILPLDAVDASLAVGPSLLSTKNSNGFLVGAAAALYLQENTDEDEEVEEITALGKVPDALNANEYARLLHCVLDNKATGSLKKITEGLECAMNSEAYEDPWDMITELFDDVANVYEHPDILNPDIKDIDPNNVRIGRASQLLKKW